MKVFVKKLYENSRLPEYNHDDDAGMDVFAAWVKDTDKFLEYGTGISLEIDPEESKDWYVKLGPRSSISKYDLVLANSEGKLDNGYRGEVILRFKKTPNLFNIMKGIAAKVKDSLMYGNLVNFLHYSFSVGEIEKRYCKYYEVGDRIGQIILEKRPKIELILSEELTETERGGKGFGSSGE